MGGRWVFLGIMAWAAVASADTIALKDHREPIEARLVDETEETFIIEVPKSQVTRVERSAPFTKRATAAAPTVRWEERDGYVILHIPQDQLERGALSAAASSPRGTGSGSPSGDASFASSAKGVPQAPVSADQRLGGIAGRVLWDGTPLADCKVKTVMVSSPQPLAMVNKLLGRSDAYADEGNHEEGYLAEATTDASGRFHIERVPPGEYDIYWQPSGQPSSQWIRRLREKPDLVVLAGDIATYPDIEAHVHTRN